ncbi:hypothetical protein Ddc_18116 [Ditylenchus destructor]|nr:hypothetical protein Ddc_18116 [Ditylenchus destructor]
MANCDNCITVSEKLRVSEDRNVQLMTQVLEKSLKARTLTNELKIAQEQIRQLETKIQVTQAPMAVLEETTQKVKSKEILRMENQLKSVESKAQQMKTEVKNIEREAEKIAGENEKLKQKIEQSRKDLDASEERYRKTNASLKECRESLETANREKEQMAEQFVKTRKEQDLTFEKYKTEKERSEKEMQTTLEQCRQEVKKAVTAGIHAYRTLTDLLPELEPKPEEPRFSVPEPKLTSVDARKGPLPETQYEPEPAIQALPPRASDKKRCHRTKSVVSEVESWHGYNLRKRTVPEPECVSCPEEKKCRRAKSMANE